MNMSKNKKFDNNYFSDSWSDSSQQSNKNKKNRNWSDIPINRNTSYIDKRSRTDVISKYNRQPLVKKSYGIILCKKNEYTGQPEALLVHKRYTYAFSEFIHGHYSGRDRDKIYILLEMMTPDELLDIWSLNFDQMWYRIWLSYEHTIHYTKKFKKFHNIFIKDDSGVKLRKMIENIKTHGSLYYEFPKGKKIVDNIDSNGNTISYEGDLECAVREFKEETNIDKKYYKIVFGFKKVNTYYQAGVKYIHTYYLALLKKKINNNFNLNVINGEVLDIKWMNLNNIKLIDSHKILEKLVKPSFNVMKKYLKNRISDYITNDPIIKKK